MADMKELIRRRLGLAGGGSSTAPQASSSTHNGGSSSSKPKRASEGDSDDGDVDHESEGPRRPDDGAAGEEDQTQPSVCDCGRCQEFVAVKRPARPPAAAAGRGRGGGRGGGGSRGRGGGSGNPWGVQNQPSSGKQVSDSDDEDGGTASTACASCGCDLIKHVVPGQLEDEDGFEDEDYDPVYGEHDD